MRVLFIKAAEIAAGQNGRITTEQLLACGFGNTAIEYAVAAGRLHREHKGVFALGHRAPSRTGTWHSAVLACGPEARLSWRCAATALRIRDGVGPRVDVTVPLGTHRRRPGIHVHRADLEPWETGTWSNIPITSPNRTMVDLAHVLEDPDEIGWALRQLQFHHLYDRRLLELSLRRRPNRTLHRLLDDLPTVQSPLELQFLTRVVRRHRLPEPECQPKLHGLHVDFFWPEARLVVEVDGRNHDLPLMRLADAHRDRTLQQHELVVRRYRHTDIHRHHRRTAAEIAALCQ
jgi:very-short-patch-repair endonuclease